MSKNYWEVRPDMLNQAELKEYIKDWFENEVEIKNFAVISDQDQLQDLKASVAQLNYALQLLASNHPLVDNLDE